MTDATAALEERIRLLEEENSALRAGSASAKEPQTGPRPRGGWWRALLAAVCITLAAILVPVSILGAWARAELVNEDAFVATFAPLAKDPDVQNLVIEKATGAIESAVDIDGLTTDLFDGIASLNLPPKAAAALQLLKQPAIAGVHSLVGQAVTGIVQSDTFATIWQKALVTSHRALVASATGDKSGVITVDGKGVVGIQLGPIIAELKSALVAQGFGFASAIPEINTTIVVAQSESLLLVSTVYNIATAVGYWLPFVTLGLFALGILIARRRQTAVLGVGVGFALGAGFLAAALTGASVVLGLQAPSLGIPSQTLNTIYFAVVGAMRDAAVVFTFLGVVIALAAWLGGRSRPARRIRRFFGSLTTSARHALQRRGLQTGRTGQWLFQQRLLVRIALVILSAIVLFSIRPVTFGSIVGTVAVALLVWLVIELLSRAPGDPVRDPSASDDDEDASDDEEEDCRARGHRSPVRLPYGTWPSPVSAVTATAASARFDGARFVGDEIWWAQSVPDEGGRMTVYARSTDGSVRDLLPAPWNARSSVHEYGGGAWSATPEGALVFVDRGDPRVWITTGGAPRPLTAPAPGIRYGGLSVQAGRLLAVRETHRSDETTGHDIVAVPLDGSAATSEAGIEVLADGEGGFVAQPALSPDGARLAWIAWRHPAMPWDGARLRVRERGGSAREIAGTGCALQPVWTGEHELTFLDDRSGRWNLARSAPDPSGSRPSRAPTPTRAVPCGFSGLGGMRRSRTDGSPRCARTGRTRSS